jgi:hypothetical protein
MVPRSIPCLVGRVMSAGLKTVFGYSTEMVSDFLLGEVTCPWDSLLESGVCFGHTKFPRRVDGRNS